MRRLGLMLVTVLLRPAASHAHDWNGMVMDSGGRIYVVDADYGEIWRVAKDGTIDTFVDRKVGETLVHPHHLAIDADDCIWVATNCTDVCVNRIFKVSPNRELTEFVWQAPKDFLLEMVIPDGHGGLFLVSAHSILHQSKGGVLDPEPFARVGSVAGAVAVVGDMQLLVGDQGTLTLCDGRKETIVARDLGEVFGVAVDDAGNRFVSDWKAGRVLKIDAAGKVTTLANHLDDPSGILVEKSGGLLVKESGRQRNRKFRILRVDSAGKATVLVDANR